jgi:hypothetical protein
MRVGYQQNPAVEAAALQDEMILLEPETNQFCILNRTAAAIWSRVAQRATEEEIVAHLNAEFDGVTEGQARHDVEETLRELVNRRLVTQS